MSTSRFEDDADQSDRATARSRRRWRFSLQTLFVLLTILCFWIGIESIIVNNRWKLRRTAEVDRVFQFQTATNHLDSLSPELRSMPHYAQQHKQVTLMRYFLGDRAICAIYFAPPVGPKHQALLDKLREAFPEAKFGPR